MVYAYTGLPGSGKTLSSLVLLVSELRAERHVFTNIAGLDPLMISYVLSAKGGKVYSRSHVEKYLHRFTLSYGNELAAESKRFCVARKGGIVDYYNSEGLSLLIKDVMACHETVVILDECHEYLNPENFASLRPFVQYISMARHYGHDLILITQHITDIWVPIQKRIHETHDFFRGQLGIRTQYKERVYYGSNILTAPGYVRQRMDDKSLYKLYKSHESGAKERMNYMSIWKSWKFVGLLLFLLALIVIMILSFRYTFGYVERLKSPSPAAVQAVPRYSENSNIVYVKYVVCGNFNCRAVRPDGTSITLPLDYDSGKYPIEVRKYVPSNNYNYPSAPPSGGRSANGVPNAR